MNEGQVVNVVLAYDTLRAHLYILGGAGIVLGWSESRNLTAVIYQPRFSSLVYQQIIRDFERNEPINKRELPNPVGLVLATVGELVERMEQIKGVRFEIQDKRYLSKYVGKENSSG